MSSYNNPGRRASAGFGDRKDIGDPYAIYTEIVNVGKNVASSKKRVKWLFGFSESSEEHEVILTHSLTSGKKIITENGIEVVNSSNVMAMEFSHGWSSPATHRLYRIEIEMSLGTDPSYIFSVDGLQFTQMPDRTIVRARSAKKTENTGRYSASDLQSTTTTAGAAVKRASVGGNSSHNQSNHRIQAETPRAQFQSPNGKDSNTFDPFAPTPDAAPFDPFSNSSSSSSSVPRLPQPAPVAKRTLPNKDSERNVSTASIDLSAAPTPRGANASGFDLFAEPSDPFAAAPAPVARASPAFDAFGSSAPASKPSLLPPKQPPAPKLSAANLFDAFEESPSTPASVVTPQVSSNNRRASAVEISMDFAGLTFAPGVAEPTVSSKSTASVSQPLDNLSAPAVPVADVEQKPVDPWANSLVDLDLTGRTQPAKRTGSAAGGPSLDSMLGFNNSQPSRRASVNNGAQLTPADILNSINDPFGAPPVLTATSGVPTPASAPYGYGSQQAMKPTLSAPLAISALGNNMPTPYGVPTMGMPMPPVAPQQRGSIGPMSGMPIMGARPAPTPGMGFPPSNGQSGKSSLDMLDWKS
eukprot:gene7045-7790_t